MPRKRALKWTLPWLASAALPLLAQPLDVFDHSPESYLGADACAACHAQEFATQSASGHALSLHPTADHPAAPSFAPSGSLVRAGGSKYSYRTDEGGLRVEITAQEQRIDALLEWAFGAGEQAVTFVGQVDEARYVEHHFSYYSANGSLGTTPGHRDVPVRGAEEALGVYYETFGPQPSIMRCFQCHSTGPLALGDGYSLRPRELGVRCEACHGPGRSHVQAVASGELEQAMAVIRNPARLPGDELLEYCGDCHRPPASSGQVIDWSDPWNVRHQPVYLSRSACLQPGGQPLTCMRCHDPHGPLSAETARDNRLCLDCHENRAPPASVCRQAADRACSFCHMPAVRPQDELRFTNHWIGVYDPDNPLRPRDASEVAPR
ncbi:MAG: hypothetical protein F4X77_14700 [Acidobacteriia bacterium]|nr:hypothetical protein [Terriglobia bacterium]